MNELQIAYEIVGTVLIVVVTFVFFEALGRLVRTIALRAGAQSGAVIAIRDGMRLVWLAVAVAMVVSYDRLASELTVLTISGVAGLLISLSLQAVFSNMVSGILLLNDQALRMGDYIEYGGVKGVVVRIALRNTWVRTDSGDIAIIGNSALTGGPLVNHTAARRFPFDLTTRRRAEPPTESPPARPAG